MNEGRIWYVNINRQTYGPYSRDEIISMLKTETVKYSDYIFRDGFKNWDYIYNISEFDRRLLNPGGDQPLVQAPKELVPEEIVEPDTQKTDDKPVDELWYVHDGENQLGPYSSSYIKEALDNKTLFWTYYVWKEGFDNWVQIKESKEFDRRKMPRGQAPNKLDISTDYEEIKKESLTGLPKKEDNPQMYSNSNQPLSVQYGISDLDQEELRGKYPVKGVLILLAVMFLLFGIVRVYPWLSERSREKRAMAMYETGIELIDRQNKPEEGFVKLFDLMDMYPNSSAERKNENYIRSKEPMLKSKLADEGRTIKKLIETFDKKYGVLPANSVDIGYVPPFWLKYFGEAYFKRSAPKKVEVMLRGIKFPIEGYVFITDSDNKDQEQDVKADELNVLVRSYTKLVYSGQKSLVKPLELPKILKTTVMSPEKQKEIKEQADNLAKKAAQQAASNKKQAKKAKEAEATEDLIPTGYEEQEDGIDNEQQGTPLEEDQLLNEETTDEQDEVTDEYEDSINKIRKGR
jgi:hypothetical protein